MINVTPLTETQKALGVPCSICRDNAHVIDLGTGACLCDDCLMTMSKVIHNSQGLLQFILERSPNDAENS